MRKREGRKEGGIKERKEKEGGQERKKEKETFIGKQNYQSSGSTSALICRPHGELKAKI